MKVLLQLAGEPVRRWHLELLERLAALPHVEVAVDGVAGPTSAAPGLERTLALERRLHHRTGGWSDQADSAALARFVSPGVELADLVINLSAMPLDDPRAWSLRFDGRTGEAAAVAALRGGRTPLVSLTHAAGTIASARPGTESPGVLVAAFDDLLAGCLTLILGSLQERPFAPASTAGLDDLRQPARSLLQHSARQVVNASAHLAYRSLYRAPHWRVGWRLIEGPGLIEQFEQPGGGWSDLPDDGRRFYADPFPFEFGGELLLFVEDYEHRVGRGVISVVRFDEQGPLHTPEPVLRHRVHLSYPFVLEHDGEIWMIPETSAAHTVELYRATGFPHRWALEAVLLVGVEASDATVFRHQDRWWMTATVRDGGSFSDALHLWHAADLTGPWLPHTHNPVLLDISSARPAGRVVARGKRLLRPVQDGRTGYGAALGLAEITRLDDQGFDQEVVGRLAPGPWWPGRRLHTVNRAGPLECIDGSAMSPRWWRPRPGKRG